MRRSRGTENLRVDHALDVRGMESADSYRKAVAQLKTMAENAILELSIDDGKSLRTIPFGLRAEGHELLISEPMKDGVRLLVKKRSLLP